MEQVACSTCCDFTTPDLSHSSLSHTPDWGHIGVRTRALSLGDGVLVHGRCTVFYDLAVIQRHTGRSSGSPYFQHGPWRSRRIQRVVGAWLGLPCGTAVKVSPAPPLFFSWDSSTGLVYWRGGWKLCLQLRGQTPFTCTSSQELGSGGLNPAPNATVVPYSVFVPWMQRAAQDFEVQAIEDTRHAYNYFK